MRVKMNRTSFLRGNRSGHHNTELKNVKTYNLTTLINTNPINTSKKKRGAPEG